MGKKHNKAALHLRKARLEEKVVLEEISELRSKHKNLAENVKNICDNVGRARNSIIKKPILDPYYAELDEVIESVEGVRRTTYHLTGHLTDLKGELERLKKLENAVDVKTTQLEKIRENLRFASKIIYEQHISNC